MFDFLNTELKVSQGFPKRPMNLGIPRNCHILYLRGFPMSRRILHHWRRVNIRVLRGGNDSFRHSEKSFSPRNNALQRHASTPSLPHWHQTANSLNTHHTLYVKNLCSKELIHAAWEQISPQLMLIASHLAELDTRWNFEGNDSYGTKQKTREMRMKMNGGRWERQEHCRRPSQG